MSNVVCFGNPYNTLRLYLDQALRMAPLDKNSVVCKLKDFVYTSVTLVIKFTQVYTQTSGSLIPQHVPPVRCTQTPCNR